MASIEYYAGVPSGQLEKLRREDPEKELARLLEKMRREEPELRKQMDLLLAKM